MSAATARLPACPPLESGDRLTREEFHRRYELHPEIRHAELIEGVVYVSSPSRHGIHGRPNAIAAAWMGAYAATRPGEVDLGVGSSVFIGGSEVQPDALLRRVGGTSRLDAEGYLEGAPELVFENAASSASYDLGVKKELYRRAGVREYIVWQIYDNRLDWFLLRDADYVRALPGVDGMIESDAFPGLRLAVDRLLAEDIAGVLAARV
jgi:Uma2 family endonuclease